MNEKLKNEGHDARLLRFSPSDDGTIRGGHRRPMNEAYWIAGCLGITEACSEVNEIMFDLHRIFKFFSKFYVSEL